MAGPFCRVLTTIFNHATPDKFPFTDEIDYFYKDDDGKE